MIHYKGTNLKEYPVYCKVKRVVLIVKVGTGICESVVELDIPGNHKVNLGLITTNGTEMPEKIIEMLTSRSLTGNEFTLVSNYGNLIQAFVDLDHDNLITATSSSGVVLTTDESSFLAVRNDADFDGKRLRYNSGSLAVPEADELEITITTKPIASIMTGTSTFSIYKLRDGMQVLYTFPKSE